jgi:hypothetical protein
MKKHDTNFVYLVTITSSKGLISLDARCKFGNAQLGFLHLREQRSKTVDQLCLVFFI